MGMERPRHLTIEQVTVEQRSTRARRNACEALSVDGKVIARLIALIVAKNIGKMIGAFF